MRIGVSSGTRAQSGSWSCPARGTRTPGRRGADLARAALDAARAQQAARRAAAQNSRSGTGEPRVRRGRGADALRRRRWSGPGADSRDPAPLAATLRGWVRQAGVGADLTRATVFGRWAEIVGAELAAHCRPLSLTDGNLLVEAESTAWAMQIRGLGPQLIARINREVGGGTVTRLRAQGPAGPSWRFGNRHVSGRGPRDTYG